jgi:ubiquinone/menaquinone biosynthesis C-methylase UbiE
VEPAVKTGQVPVAEEGATAAWSRYWASGMLHSCPGAFTGNYGDEVRSLWTEFFGTLASGSRVLDIGTGNGAVAFIAREVAAQNGATVEIEAIDSATIDPARAAKAANLSVEGITFRGHVPAEATGYPESWFDVVSGQYALEHTRVNDTLAELARIVKPAGEVLFVIQHAGSAGLDALRAELAHFDFLEHNVPLIVHTRRFLKRLAGATTMPELRKVANDAQSRAQLAEIRQMAQQVDQRGKSQANGRFLSQIAGQAMGAIQEANSTGPAVALRKLNQLTEEVLSHRDRIRSIVRSAHSQEDMQRLAQEFKRAGFVPEPERELMLRGSMLIGWVLRARRE